MAGPQGRRLRVELAGPARRVGDPAVARTLLARTRAPTASTVELRADVLTELARCAVDDAPDTADRRPGRGGAGVARHGMRTRGRRRCCCCAPRATGGRAGRPLPRWRAVTGLATRGRRRAAGGGAGSDHLAAALTAEWIAALVDAGRVDEARSEAVPRQAGSSPRRARAASSPGCASRSPGSPLCGPRAAADAVLPRWSPRRRTPPTATSPSWSRRAARCSASCTRRRAGWTRRSSAVRAAMAAERRDHDRAARLRTRLAAATATWAGRPSSHEAIREPEWRCRRPQRPSREAAAPWAPARGRGAAVPARPTTWRPGADAGPARRRIQPRPAAVPRSGTDRARAHGGWPGRPRRAPSPAVAAAWPPRSAGRPSGWPEAPHAPELGATVAVLTATPGCRELKVAGDAAVPPPPTTGRTRDRRSARPAGRRGSADRRRRCSVSCRRRRPRIPSSAVASRRTEPVGRFDPALQRHRRVRARSAARLHGRGVAEWHPGPNASPRTGTGQVAPATAGAVAAPHPTRRPTSVGTDGVPDAGPVGTVRHAVGRGPRRRSARHPAPPAQRSRPSAPVEREPPTRGPRRRHGGNPGDSRGYRVARGRRTRPGCLLAPAGRGRSATSRHRRPRPRRPAGRRARRLPQHLSRVDAQTWQDLQPGSPGPAQGRVGHATGLPWSRQAG